MTGTAQALVAVHLFATAAMTGLIWFVQMVHYPLFSSVGAVEFTAYERLHQRRTSFVVGPLMALEGATAVWLAVFPPEPVGRAWPVLGLGVLGAIQLSTVLRQVPLHGALAVAFDAERVHRLVRTNWVRTIGWSLRGVLATFIVLEALSP